MAYRQRELIVPSVQSWRSQHCHVVPTFVLCTSTARGAVSADSLSSKRNQRAWPPTMPPPLAQGDLWQSSKVWWHHSALALSDSSCQQAPVLLWSCPAEHRNTWLAVHLQPRRASAEQCMELGTLPALPYTQHPDAFQELVSPQNQRATHCKEYLCKDFSAMLEMQGVNLLGCRISLFNVSFTPLSNLLVCCNQDSNISQLAAR